MQSKLYKVLGCRSLIGLLLALQPLSLFAQGDAAVSGLTDHSLIDGYPYSEIIERQLQRDSNYRIILGGLERVRGEVIPEAFERLRGDVTRITYEVSQEFTGADVYEFFREQLDQRNYELLFECQGRACGSSNYWANDIFRNRILYGPESNQYYMAFRADQGIEDAPYFSVYIITRVNRRIYAYVEVVEPGGTLEPEQVAAQEAAPTSTATADSNTESLLQRLRQQGSVRMPAVAFEDDDSLPQAYNVDAIATSLNRDQTLNVYLVAHLSQEGQALDILLRRSEARANAVRQALIAAGVTAGRIVAAGVGPLAPSCSGGGCEERVELVLR